MKVVSEREKLSGALAYLLFFVTGILVLMSESRSKQKSSFIRFHALQSVFFFVPFFMFMFLIGYIGFIGWIVWAITPFPVFVLWMYLMAKAYRGEMYRLPYISALVDLYESKSKSF